MIRAANGFDRPVLVRMARDFMATAGMPFDAAYADNAFREHMAAPNTLTLALEVGSRVRGVLSAAITRFPLGPQTFAQELIFWIDPDVRGKHAIKMIAAYEAWAREHGCWAVNLVTFGPMAADNLYNRMGYEPSERHFVKVL